MVLKYIYIMYVLLIIMNIVISNYVCVNKQKHA